jgi:hypothetical protein
MRAWQVVAAGAALLFGAHNLFVKRAAGRIPDTWGAFAVEASATVTVLACVGVMVLAGEPVPAARDMGGVLLAAIAGVFVGRASILYFWVFRLGAPLSVAVPWVLTGWMLFATVLGAVLEDEVLGGRRAAGLAAAVLAIWLLR